MTNRYKVTIENLETGEKETFTSEKAVTHINDIPVFESKPKTIWELSEGDEYWFTATSTRVPSRLWENSKNDNSARDCGDVFLTKQEAEKELEKRKAIQRIKKWKWKNGIKSYDTGIYITYRVDAYGDCFETTTGHIYTGSPVGGFLQTVDAEKCIKDCENDLKIIFNVE